MNETKLSKYAAALNMPVEDGKCIEAFERLYRGSVSSKETKQMLMYADELMRCKSHAFYIIPRTQSSSHCVVIFLDQRCKYVEIFVPDANKPEIDRYTRVVSALCATIFSGNFQIIASSVALTTSDNQNMQEMMCAQYIWLRAQNVPLIIAERHPHLSELFVDKAGIFGGKMRNK